MNTFIILFIFAAILPLFAGGLGYYMNWELRRRLY
jgi:hypothetical protein